MDEQNNVNDAYYWNYFVLLTALANENMEEGIGKSLYFAKLFFNCDNMIIYRQNEVGEYVHKHNQSLMNSNSNITTSILNSARAIMDKKNLYEMHPNIEGLHNMAFISVKTDKHNYVIALTGDKELKNLNNSSIEIFTNTMKVILNKYEQIHRLSMTGEIDSLTGLSNRNAYEYDVRTKTPSEGTIYMIFDLFSLKGINDRYSHEKGDEYIKKSADILKKHFPRYIYTVDKTGKKTKSETGSYLYRVGGDEFVLITNTEQYHNALIKAMVIQEEIKNLDLGVDNVIGINYGMIEAKNDDTFRDLYLKADCLLQNNKTAMYQELNIERRNNGVIKQ